MNTMPCGTCGSRPGGGFVSETRDGFDQELMQLVVDGMFGEHYARQDELRFGLTESQWSRANLIPSAKMKLHNAYRAIGRRMHVTTIGSGAREAAEAALQLLGPAGSDYRRAYALLDDRQSRQRFVQIVALHLLGPNRVRMPLDHPDFWHLQKLTASLRDRSVAPLGIAKNPLTDELGLFDLSPAGFDIRLYGHPLNILNTFLLHQYELPRAGVAPVRGDVVVDCGACWGDTALFFAARVGEAGRVIAFEFDPGNLAVLRENLRLNPHLASRITIVERPLWAKPDVSLSARWDGPASCLELADVVGTSTVTTESLDNYVEEAGVEAIGFVKMDIEGAEIEALKGAELTLRTHRPTLAVSAYHNASRDLIDVPICLSDLDLGYDLFLEHYTVHREESVVYARPRGC